MLSPYRVLDLTDTRAELGPMILADLGADVVKVEPPRGSDSRWAEPLAPGAPDGMASLRFHAFNRGKRSVTIDLDAAHGRAAFLDLVRGADFLIENAEPGAMAARGLGYDDLAKLSPRLVYVAITPFGQDGPYSHQVATDLTLAAMGGMMALNGDPDRAPVRVSVPQAWSHAAAESAVAALVAHFRRLTTGRGQYVDLSVQASVFWTGLNAMIAAAIDKDIQRAGTLLQLGIISMPLVYRCADGEAVIAPTGVTMRKLLNWMVEDGVIPESWLTEEDWATYDLRFLTGQPLKIQVETVVGKLAEYTPRHTKNDLLERGIREGITIAPVTTTADVLAFAHLHERGYWQDYALPGDGSVKMPGPFVRLAKTPIAPQRPAPTPGQDNAAILGTPRTPPSSHLPPRSHGGLPFAGLKVADFSWIGVGPITAKYLGDHGATVVRIESGNPVDRLRGAGPHKDGIPGTNRSQFYGAFNTSKLGINMNLKRPEAQAVAKRLLAWCDVALESFTPGTMADLGLGYDVARKLNPGIIMVSSCLMGQTGPAAPLAGYGYHAAAISGFYEVTGWDDRPPGGPFNAYTDVIAPHFLGATLMAALDHRRRTGEGQYIEQAQMESALYFLAPELLEYQVTGRKARRMGNDSATAAPHGAYPTAGTDQWVAIAIETDEQWRALRTALGDPEWARDPAFATAAGRIAARRAIDTRIAAFTAPRDRYEVMDLLQRHGVPAGAVQRSSDLLHDPQLAHRHFFHPLEHEEMGLVPYEGHQFNIRGYESGPRSPAPLLGEHSFVVLTDVLGMSADAAAEVMASGAVE